MSADVRTALNKFLHKHGRGAQSRMAKAAGISTAAVSQFRHGCYPANKAIVEAKILKVLENSDVTDRIAAGELKAQWLVHTRKGLRLIKRKELLNRLKQEDPEIHVVTVWTGDEPKDIHISFTSSAQSADAIDFRKVCHDIQANDAAQGDARTNDLCPAEGPRVHSAGTTGADIGL